MECSHCKKDPGPKEAKSQLWNGFYDLDTQQHVCHSCRHRHYRLKFSNPALRGYYSEVPVTLNNYEK